MHAERTDIGAGLAANPEDAEMPVVVELVQLALVDRPDAQLSLDGRYKRRSLEQRARQSLQSPRELRFPTRQSIVEPYHTDVFLPRTLLTFDESGGAVEAHDETTCDFGVERAAVSRLLDPQHALDPGDDFMGGWIRGLVEVDHAGGDVGFEVALERGATVWNGGEVTGADEYLK